MQLNYCPQCGAPLSLRAVGDEGLQPYCTACQRFFFDNPACCVLTAIINESAQVLLLRQRHISDRWTLCSGYVKKGDTLEETVIREVLEETGQRVKSCRYVGSWYFAPKGLLMAGFIAHVTAGPFARSAEVDGLMWFPLADAQRVIARENNLSGEHLDACVRLLSQA